MTKPTVTTVPATTRVEASYSHTEAQQILRAHMLREAGIPVDAPRVERAGPAGAQPPYPAFSVTVELQGDYTKPVKCDPAPLVEGFNAPSHKALHDWVVGLVNYHRFGAPPAPSRPEFRRPVPLFANVLDYFAQHYPKHASPLIEQATAEARAWLGGHDAN